MFNFSSPRAATLFEQAIVSVTGFLSMLFFARHLEVVEWATFSFAYSLLLVAQGMQLSMVILPMISFSKGDMLSPVDQCNWTWMNRVLLGVMLIISIGVACWIIASSSSWMGNSFFYAALLMPPAFTYEYLRRRLILTRQYSVLARAAAGYSFGVGLGVLCNYSFSWPPFFTALSFWPGMAFALLLSGTQDPVRWAAPSIQWMSPLKAFAPSAVGSSLAFAGYNFIVQFLLGTLSGPLAVASFNATRMLIQPINTLIGAFNNLDMPNAARQYSLGGRFLIRFQIRAVVRLLAIGGVYLAILCVFPSELLTLIFHGRYSETDVLFAWVIVGILMMIVTPTENVFYMTRRTGLLFISRLLAACGGVLAALYVIPKFGTVGAIYSISAGWFIAFVGGSLALWSVREHVGSQAAQ